MSGALAKTSGQQGRQRLSKYDPEKGLKTIAVFKMAAKEYARVGDIERVETAIRAELDAEAEFILWWDTKGPGAIGKGNVADRGHYSGKDGLPDRQVIHRWRKNLNDPKAFEKAYERICLKTIKSIRFESVAHVGQNSGEYEWYTPAEYIEAARSVLGDIDLDPATTTTANDVVKASQIFTAEESGLDQPWHGRVWMNPPYSQPLIEHFCEKFAQHAERGEITGIVLVNNATETTWFQRLASATMCFCFPKGRIRFWSPRGESATPLQGQVFCYTGADTVSFSKAFRDFGFIAEHTA